MSKQYHEAFKSFVLLLSLPGRMKMNTAARDPRSRMTEPMLGMDTESRIDSMNLETLIVSNI